MQKRLRFGLVIGAVVVVLVIVAFAGQHALLRADSNLPGSNCTGGTAFVDITIENGKLASSLASFSPSLCYTFTITNNDQKAYDFLIKDPGNNTILAAVTNVAAGDKGTVDYQFAPATSETPIDLIYTAPGTTDALGSAHLFLAQ
jgi:hypothetical protein